MTWYIAVTNPNCHRRAENGLAAIGYQAFWPKYRKWASHARTKVAKEFPVLGRYLFVEVRDANFWAVRTVNGVEGLLTGDSGAPAEVKPEDVFDFRERYMRGEWDFVSSNRLPIGARIRIMEGEFAHLLTVVRGNRQGKIRFLPPGRREFVTTRESNVRAA